MNSMIISPTVITAVVAILLFAYLIRTTAMMMNTIKKMIEGRSTVNVEFIVILLFL